MLFGMMEMIGFDGLDVRMRERDKSEMSLNSWLDSGGKMEKSKPFCIYVGFWVGAH